MIWSDLQNIFRFNQTFCITSHVSPDGDSIGSQLALAWYLQNLGKTATIYNVDPVPSKFTFLAGSSSIRTVRPDGPFDVLVVLDSSNPARLGWEGSGDIAKIVINMDHHGDNTGFGTCNIVRNVSATGEIIFSFFKECSIDIPPHVAEYLYTAIMTDTGGFRFSNTSSRVLRCCAELADRGADCSKIFELAYASHSQSSMRVRAHIWSTVAFHLDDRVCTMELPLRIIGEMGASYGDSEGMADLTISVDGIEIGMLVKHDENRTHFSLRSKGARDVGKIARKVMGGGGHKNAAGCTIEEKLEIAFPHMLAIIKQELD